MPAKPEQPKRLPQPDLLSAHEACEILRIKQATLYTYVSRGLLKPVRPPNSNTSLYAREDVDSLQVRRSARAGHGPAAAMAMRWGQPVLSTSITELTPSGPCYRGHLAEDLCRDPGVFENVAELLWSGVLPDDRRPWRLPPIRVDVQRALDGVQNLDIRIGRVFAFTATALGGVSLADELRSGSIPSYSHELLLAFASASGVLGPRARFVPPSGETHVANHVLHALGADASEEAARAVNAALILAADHELATATFVARVAASVGSGLHACVVAALAAQAGSKLSGVCDSVEQLLSGIRTDAQMKSWVRAAEQRRERLPAFGLALYPDGDPRSRSLITLAQRIAPNSPEVTLASEFVAHVRKTLGVHANIEVGLVILGMALRLPARSAAALWTIGRTAGWIAHVLEQRRAGYEIRPRGHFIAQAY